MTAAKLAAEALRKGRKPLPTVERLKECLYYDPETGTFTRIWPPHQRGRVTGWKNSNGYLRILIDGEQYLAHRLAFLYMTGHEPRIFLDHIDRDKTNNRWSNLREADRRTNAANSKLVEGSTSGLKGAQKTRNHRWRSTIRIGGRRVYLGTFDTAEEAHAAYRRVALGVHGEYARMS